MSKRAPSTTQLLVITGFALSCFGILLFLWVTFGGPTPFRAKTYEVKVPFNEATQLAEQSDVRISGVNVGKVQKIELAPNGKQAWATAAIDARYAPLPESTRAILRTKTLLGETYIELTPGSREGPELEDGGTLPEANVAESVQLDEIFRTFNAQTRAAFQEWMQEAAVAINGQGQNLSYALGSLDPTVTEFDQLFRVLDSQRLAVGQLFRNGATTFQALRGREGQLADLIQSSNAVFQTTARRDRDIEALFRAFPTFLDESRLTFARLKGFSQNADPLMRQLVPAAEELSPTLIALAKLAPESKAFFEGLGPVIKRAPTGFAALRTIFRDEFPPLLRAVDPFIRNLNPILVGLKLYRVDLASFFGNVAASLSGELPAGVGEPEGAPQPHYLRIMGGMNPETISTYPHRLAINRNSAYSPPKWAEGLIAGLPSFDTRQCTSGIVATLDPTDWEDPAFKERAHEFRSFEDPTKVVRTQDEEAKLLFERIQQYAFAGQTSTAGIAAPPCKQQEPFKPIYGSGPATQYQHTFDQSGP
ncbi:MAG: phospholipid/cholesterol/gamma-HCH transport system substrate-binding protein [Solirubrobacterales bacterium]|jgi:virulence factor Mce-like protein|nr:phospholipid/cholesterol/gamma-HCH transport system substrate-binding protein [Solirubrobacterales bacterium]